MNRIAGRDPPAADCSGRPAHRRSERRSRIAGGPRLACRSGPLENRPCRRFLLQNVTVDGHIYSAPVDIHGANWMFYSTKIFQELKLQPPKSWDEFFAQASKLQAAGYTPLAFGAMPSRRAVFMALLAGIGGSDVYRAVAVAHDAKARAARASKPCSTRWDGCASTSMPVVQPQVERHLGTGGNQQGSPDDSSVIGRRGLLLPPV